MCIGVWELTEVAHETCVIHLIAVALSMGCVPLQSQVTLIEQLFCGRLQSSVQCEECGACSNT